MDTEDDVYLEFEDEDEPVKQEEEAPATWQLIARYMANFKPNTKAMFTRFTEEVWHLRSRIDYAEKGKNYYMITLHSKGDYDFVKKGGPWIFKKHALIIKDFDKSMQPSDIKLDKVPVWVRIYNVPFEKQNEVWGRRYGDGLGETIEVDVPESELKKHEFLRVRVNLPYNKRLQTQITTGIKGKPWTVKVFKLKYERVPYYCSHRGFMGHQTDVCEKKKPGVPSLGYDLIELRCSPYKQVEQRSYTIPPKDYLTARRGLSFSSFGSAESRKVFDQEYGEVSRKRSGNGTQVHQESESDDNEMPPLADDIVPGAIDAYGNKVGYGKTEQEDEVRLAAQVAAMQMDTHEQVTSVEGLGGREIVQVNREGKGVVEPIIQFPEEDETQAGEQNCHIQVTMTEDMLAKLQQANDQVRQQTNISQASQSRGPRPSDMIRALQGLSSLQVSFGSVNDTTMQPADSVLGKRNADDQEEQCEQLDLSLGLAHGQKKTGGTPKKGRMQAQGKEQSGQGGVDVFYTRKKLASTGHKPTGNLTRPNVWSRKAQ
jgi:hypothetical protein